MRKQYADSVTKRPHIIGARVKHLVTVQWSVPESCDPATTAPFERLMARARSRGLVKTWDDGRSRWMWYEARRGPEERDLRARCVAAIGHAPVEVLV